MEIRRQPHAVTALYAELVEQVTALEAEHSLASVSGGFSRKTVKGREYWYFQYRDLHGRMRQHYFGPVGGPTDRFVEVFTATRESLASDQENIERLCAALKKAGALSVDAPTFKVLHAFAESGLFHRGAVLIGTHAFNALGNALGVRWEGTATATRDIDVAQGKVVGIAVPAGGIDVPDVLENLKMGFHPVPPLNPKHPSTSFKVRGKELRVDLLTPARGGATKPVHFSALNAAATPLPFLDYLLEASDITVLIGRTGILVRVPDPARFAFHKLLVSQRRAATSPKKGKDVWQAAQLFAVLLEDNPGALSLAWEALVEHEPAWTKKARTAHKTLAARYPDVAAALADRFSELA